MKGEMTTQILLKTGFAIKLRSKNLPRKFIEWQDGHCHIPVDMVNKIAPMSPPISKNEIQAFLEVVVFWRMHIPNKLY